MALQQYNAIFNVFFFNAIFGGMALKNHAFSFFQCLWKNPVPESYVMARRTYANIVFTKYLIIMILTQKLKPNLIPNIFNVCFPNMP